MSRQHFRISNEKGFALIYTAGTLTVMLLFTGLAVDAGRAYVVKAQLSKAVDGAALGAARMLNSGDPRARRRGSSRRTSRPAISARRPAIRPAPATSTRSSTDVRRPA